MLSVNRRMPLDQFFTHLDTGYEDWVIKRENGSYVLECKRSPRLLPAFFWQRMVTASTLCDFVWKAAGAGKSRKI